MIIRLAVQLIPLHSGQTDAVFLDKHENMKLSITEFVHYLKVDVVLVLMNIDSTLSQHPTSRPTATCVGMFKDRPLELNCYQS